MKWISLFVGRLKAKNSCSITVLFHWAVAVIYCEFNVHMRFCIKVFCKYHDDRNIDFFYFFLQTRCLKSMLSRRTNIFILQQKDLCFIYDNAIRSFPIIQNLFSFLVYLSECHRKSFFFVVSKNVYIKLNIQLKRKRLFNVIMW